MLQMQQTLTVRDNIDSCKPQLGPNNSIKPVEGVSVSLCGCRQTTTSDRISTGQMRLKRAGSCVNELVCFRSYHEEPARESKQVAVPQRQVSLRECKRCWSKYGCAPNDEQQYEQQHRHRQQREQEREQEQEQKQEQEDRLATDCCNTRRANRRRRHHSLSSLWNSNSPSSVSGSASRANLGFPIGSFLAHSHQANQFTSASLMLHSSYFPRFQRHKHSSSSPVLATNDQLNNKLSSHGREHIKLANNTTTQSSGAYRWCASSARNCNCNRNRDGSSSSSGSGSNYDAAAAKRRLNQGEEEAASGCGGCAGEQHNYDTSRAHQQACQGDDYDVQDAQQQPPAPPHSVLPEAPQVSHKSCDNNSLQLHTQTNHNNNHHNITCSIQLAPQILASPVCLTTGTTSSQPVAPQQPAPPPPAPLQAPVHNHSYATSPTTICFEKPPGGSKAKAHSFPLSKPAFSKVSSEGVHIGTPTSEGRRRAMELLCAETRTQCTKSLVEQPLEQATNQLPRTSNYITRTQRTTYPNNTLIADLNKCHRNVARAWPQGSWLGARFKSCWRSATGAPAKFRRLKFHMPNAVIQSNVSITHDDYDRALCVLTSDVRYQLHLLLYKRVQVIWMLFTTLFCTLAALVLVSNLESIVTVGPLCAWLALQLVGALVTSCFRRKLDEMLEKSVAQVNSFFMEHNLMLGVINSGNFFLSKSKFLIPMLYFNTTPCREYIESIISIDSCEITTNNSNHKHHPEGHHNDDTSKSYCQPAEANQIVGCNGNRSGPLTANDTANSISETTMIDKHILDYSKIGLPQTKPNQMGLAQSQLAKKIILRYSQRWISLFDKQKLMFSDDQVQPRHLSTGKCLCQFVEEHFCKNNINNHQSKRIKTHNCKPLRLDRPRTKRVVNNQQVSVSILTEPIPNGKRHISLLESYMLAKPTSKISTLSRLVSLRDRKHYNQECSTPVTATTNSTCQSEFAQANHLQPFSSRDPIKGGYLNGILYTPNLILDPSDKSTIATANLSQTNGSLRSPTSSPDVSLEMDAESISRSDELVKKLRLLLELKKDEIQSLEGPLFSPTYCRESPRSTLTNDSNEACTGKKMYLQRYGLFFLGASGAKKNHHHHHEETGRNHSLEMC